MVVQTYRLIVSVHSPKAGFDKGRVVLVLVGCVIVCGIVAALPFVGTADYTPYSRPMLCHIRWIPFDHANIAYFTSIAIVFFVLPTVLISTIYASIYFKTTKSSLKSLSSTRSKHRHIFMLKTFLIITVAYILTWSPYVVCIVLDLSGIDHHSYSHVIYLLCTMVAKVSLTWIPVIFVIRHSHYKKELDTLTHGVIEKVGQLTMSSAEYNLDSTDRTVEGEIAVENELIPSKPVLISYNISDDAL
ncbi:melanopsin-A-like [Mytilus trossulus]|uniref:melanopsin-A-like n=1 Tax=Mytilus trossulus TaxID=6551 RepID=UPI0030072ACA